MPRIEVRNGKAAGRSVELKGSTVTLGNRRNATIELKDSWVSFNHAQITCQGDKYFLADAHSRAGTYLNDRKVDRTPVPINPGDRILLGKTEIVVIPDAGATKTAPAASAAADLEKIRALEAKLESLEREHRQATGDLVNLREHVVAREKELAATSEKLRQLASRPKADPAETARWQKQVEDLKAAARARLDEVGRYVKQLEARLQQQAGGSVAPDDTGQLIEKERQIARLHEEIQKVKEDSQRRLLEAAERLQKEAGDPTEVEAERKRADDLEREAGILRSRVEDLESDKKKLEGEIKQVRAEITAYEQALEERNKDVERLEAIAGGSASRTAPAASSDGDTEKLRAALAAEKARTEELTKQVIDLRTQVEEINQDMLEQEDELREEIAALEKKLAETQRTQS